MKKQSVKIEIANEVGKDPALNVFMQQTVFAIRRAFQDPEVCKEYEAWKAARAAKEAKA